MNLLFLLLACGDAGPALVFHDTSSGGTYTVSTAEEPISEGEAVVPLHIEDADGPAEGLAVEVDALMDEMDHGHAAGDAVELGEGDYAVSLLFTMTGAWSLHGAIIDAEAVERFTLVVEVQ